MGQCHPLKAAQAQKATAALPQAACLCSSVSRVSSQWFRVKLTPGAMSSAPVAVLAGVSGRSPGRPAPAPPDCPRSAAISASLRWFSSSRVASLAARASAPVPPVSRATSASLQPSITTIGQAGTCVRWGICTCTYRQVPQIRSVSLQCSRSLCLCVEAAAPERPAWATRHPSTCTSWLSQLVGAPE